jgi:hypothetical protein
MLVGSSARVKRSLAVVAVGTSFNNRRQEQTAKSDLRTNFSRNLWS